MRGGLERVELIGTDYVERVEIQDGRCGSRRRIELGAEKKREMEGKGDIYNG